MNEIVAIVEGPTERTFIQELLAAHLGMMGLSIRPIGSGKKGKKTGVPPKWESARSDIIRCLKQGKICTTMFDYYGMPEDWPGRKGAKTKPWNERGDFVENAILDDIHATIGDHFNPEQFIPYIQVHEFEALLFSDVDVLTDLCRTIGQGITDFHFNDILERAGNAEAINDGYDTCPSRRITNLVKPFKKPVHGLIVAQRIGLTKMREACPHFSSWVGKLEALAS